MSKLKRMKLHMNRTHHDKAVIHFYENSTCQAAQTIWLQNGFIRDVVAKLSKTVVLEYGEKLRTLGVGSGEGELECELLRSLLQKFPRIINHVIEPSEFLLNKYKRRLENDTIKGVTFKWNLETIQSFRQHRDDVTNENPTKFHFISALNSLYYLDDLGKWLDYLYDDLLEDGGILVLILTSDTSGQGHLNKKYLIHDWWYNTSQKDVLQSDRDTNGLCHGMAEDHFKNRGIHYENVIIRCQCNVTECFDTGNPTLKSDLLLDFFSNIINFRQNVENTVFKEFLNVLGSDACSDKRNSEVLLNYDYVATVVTKKL